MGTLYNVDESAQGAGFGPITHESIAAILGGPWKKTPSRDGGYYLCLLRQEERYFNRAASHREQVYLCGPVLFVSDDEWREVVAAMHDNGAGEIVRAFAALPHLHKGHCIACAHLIAGGDDHAPDCPFGRAAAWAAAHTAPGVMPHGNAH